MFVCTVDSAQVLRGADRSSSVNTYAWLRKRMPKRLITLAPMAMIVESLPVHGCGRIWMENISVLEVQKDLAKVSTNEQCTLPTESLKYAWMNQASCKQGYRCGFSIMNLRKSQNFQ